MVSAPNTESESSTGAALFRLLVESVQDYAIFVLDPDGHVLTWNLGAQAIKGYSKAEIVGKHFSVFYPDEAVKSGWPLRELALAEKEGRFVDEGWRVKKDGSLFWASVTITALRDAAGNLAGFAKVTVDLTHRRKAEERIQDLNKELRVRLRELEESRRLVELRTVELQNLSGRVLNVQDEERRRIARDLHDDVGQQLAAISMAVQSRNFEPLNRMLESVVASVRNLSYLLHPPLLDESGLRAALHWFVDGFAERSHIQTALSIEPSASTRMSQEVETTIFRIVQESLTNVYRHSQSKRARVEIVIEIDRVSIRIRDYGKGMATLPATALDGSVAPWKLGVGISGMRERVRQFGGELTVSNAEPGTLVEATIPLFK